MRTHSTFFVIAVALVANLTVGCTGSDGGSGSSTPATRPSVAPSTEEKPEPKVTTPYAAPAPAAAVTAPPPASDECPGDLANDAVFANYRAIGVEIQIDCVGMRTSRYFQYSRPSEIAGTLRVLDRTLELFKTWPQRPAKIVIGEATYHSSKDNTIYLPYLAARQEDLESYLHDTRLLMDLEINEFNREVRFSYVDYKLARKATGEVIEMGTGAVLGYGPSREEIVKRDIERARKLKNLISQSPYKNVRLTHANQFGSFNVYAWDDSYTLPTEYTDAQLAPYFKYLTKLSKAQKAYGEIKVVVLVPVYPALEIDRALVAVDTVAGARESIQALGAKSVFVSDNNVADLHRRFSVKMTNGGLRVDNLYGTEGKVKSASELKTCIAKADFTKSPVYYCDGRGDLRF